MASALTYCIAALAIVLVLAKPRILGRRLNPAVGAGLGACAMLAIGSIEISQVGRLAGELWRSFLVLVSIMVMTEVATRVGLLRAWANRLDSGATSTVALFTRLFILSVGTAAALNNDAAILLLTPLAVVLVQQRFSSTDAATGVSQQRLLVVFAFGVFMGAGVAPFVVSNPMNMIVADYSGIGFNDYALRMVPIAVVGWVVAFFILRFLFRNELRAPLPANEAAAVKPFSRPQLAMMTVLGGSLVSYPIVSLLGSPVWLVALGAALVSLLLILLVSDQLSQVVGVFAHGIAWETLVFLVFILLLANGLEDAGLVAYISDHYVGASHAEISVTSAAGSAVLNNHPMAYINMLGLEAAGQPDSAVLAALIGGDLGPRLLPIGSLAGLLWIELLRRRGIEIRLWRFVSIGFLVTVPTLALSVLVLNLLT